MIDYYLKPLKLFLFLFFSQIAFGQLSNFTLNVTVTNETCTANGALGFNVTGTTAGSTIVYEIYHLPNLTTPIAVLNTNTFTGLVAGNYRVVAIQSLGSLTNNHFQDVVIANQVVLLTYQLVGEDEICGHDGKITVNVTSGNAVQYEIFQGPIIKPLQTSNVFTGLVAGQYQVRVFDNCGEGVVHTYTIAVSPNGAGLLINISNNINFINCSTSEIHVVIDNAPSQQVKYPLNITISVQNPSGGSPTVYNSIFNSGSQYLSFYQNVVLYPNQAYSINLHVVDGCGNNYNSNFTANSNIQPNLLPILDDCNHWDINISAISATLISAPSTFTHSLPYNLPNLNLPYVLPGTYVFQLEDICHGFTTQQIILTPPLGVFYAFSQPGCNIGYGEIQLFSLTSALTSAVLTAAPNTYPYSLPHDISNLITSGSIFLSNVLPGSYTFLLTDVCGYQSVNVVNVIGYQEVTNVVIIPNCGSFDIDLHHSGNNQVNNYPTYILQVYNSVTNQWINPLNGGSGGIPLVNNAINYNFPYTGHFRILKQFAAVNFCNNSIYEFDFTGQPKINDVYSFSCINGTYDVLVDAIGMPPLLYRITQKNGQPFVVNNGNSYVFLGLQPATYNFQVEDACGNILNSLFEVPRPFNFAITPQGLCNGSPGSLVVPNFSILQYQWWNDSNPSVILSTTNTLQFPNFNPVTAAGIYHVRVRYTGNPNSCIDFTLDYTISSSSTTPNAGQNNAVTYCGNPTTIDLFSLILGSYDTGGTWQELTTSGMLTNNIWNATNVPSGIYNFKYKVIGQCNAFDEATITITIKSMPPLPIASADPIVCDTNALNLYATFIPNSIYNWTGPNGFSSTDQNPTITSISNSMSGTYTVSAIQDGCVSGSSSVTVLVNPLPNFVIESACLNLNFVLTATAVQNSFNAASVSYNWAGPNGFSAIGNPIQITGGERGMYYATITDANGCFATQSIDVQTTLCGIPNVISPNNDGYNDALDLIGFEVVNLQIFNRWGRLVYEKNNYLQEWHGQNKEGNDLPTGTYFYFATLNTGEEMRGWIEVLR